MCRYAAAMPKSSHITGSVPLRSGTWSARGSRGHMSRPTCVSAPGRAHKPAPTMGYPDHILHWIDDGEAASSGGATFEKRSPIDDRVAATVTRGTATDVAR